MCHRGEPLAKIRPLIVIVFCFFLKLLRQLWSSLLLSIGIPFGPASCLCDRNSANHAERSAITLQDWTRSVGLEVHCTLSAGWP